jgi:PhnB protein
MIGPKPYVHFPGTARDALAFYADVFGGTVHLHTLAEFGRSDGPAEAIAHGYLDGPVAIYGADAVGPDGPLECRGLMLSLLGAADPATLTGWFSRLADGGRVLDDLQQRPWGASDGQVVDRFGLHWLVGFEPPAEG